MDAELDIQSCGWIKALYFLVVRFLLMNATQWASSGPEPPRAFAQESEADIEPLGHGFSQFWKVKRKKFLMLTIITHEKPFRLFVNDSDTGFSKRCKWYRKFPKIRKVTEFWNVNLSKKEGSEISGRNCGGTKCPSGKLKELKFKVIYVAK